MLSNSSHIITVIIFLLCMATPTFRLATHKHASLLLWLLWLKALAHNTGIPIQAKQPFFCRVSFPLSWTKLIEVTRVLLSLCFSCKNIALKTFTQIYACDRSQDSDWQQAGRQRGRSLSPSRVKNFFSSSRLDRLWGSCILLSIGARGSYPGGKAAGAWSWPQLVLRSRKCGSIQPLPHMLSWRSA
jgi:hypothetical protein